jgi:hypothetical protein
MRRIAIVAVLAIAVLVALWIFPPKRTPVRFYCGKVNIPGAIC